MNYKYQFKNKESVTYLNTFLAETIQMDTQAFIIRAKNVLEVQLRLLS